jgi:hypothetical protein
MTDSDSEGPRGWLNDFDCSYMYIDSIAAEDSIKGHDALSVGRGTVDKATLKAGAHCLDRHRAIYVIDDRVCNRERCGISAD